MYNKRLKIFIFFCLFMVGVCLLRLGFMQQPSSQKQAIKEIQKQRLIPAIQLPTLRGKILDRNGKVLAIDKPKFNVYVNYMLTRLLDPRWQQAKMIQQIKRGKSESEAEEYLREFYADDIRDIYKVIDVCAKFKNVTEQSIRDRIDKINDGVWRMREYLAWRKHYPNGGAMVNFEIKEPDTNKRIELALRERIIEMYQNYELLELENEDDKFTAEIALANIEKANVSAEPQRDYPFGTAASQIIGWVKPVASENQTLIEMLKLDELASYQDKELGGFRGVEWVCEATLRGRRGKVEYDRDGNLVQRTDTQFGKDVTVSLDIGLQQEVEKMLTDPSRNPRFYNTSTAAVLLDVKTGEVLAMASVPTFDLNLARTKYNEYFADPNQPFLNRAIEKIYPPGSTVKPLILIAALEEGKITPGTVISCPYQKAPKGWPSCWIYRQAHSCHDYLWTNTARNAIKGSCNIYCSHTANMIDSRRLQKWLYDFGYGRRILKSPNLSSLNLPDPTVEELNRNLRQAGGVIWYGLAKPKDVRFEDIKKLPKFEKRWFGIGQGSLRCNVLQAANEMASIARGGIFVQPTLYKGDDGERVNLNISHRTIATIKDGMYAVVNESHGTANSIFKGTNFKKKGVSVHGKTGSTQNPANAWFAGFFEDTKGRAISMAIIVEGGTSGAQDAAPLGKELVKICIDIGLIGND